MKCPNCKNEVNPEWKTCPFCNYEPRMCNNKNCHRQWLPPEARFCPECGKTLSNTDISNPIISYRNPIAFLLTTEFDQTNAYCLYEGLNIFGSMQAEAHKTNYQMLVLSDNSLKPQHFGINIRKDTKRFIISVSPMNETCSLALNSKDNAIKGESIIHINDMLFIGGAKIQILDNFNKTLQ